MKKVLLLGWIMVLLLSACEEDKNSLAPAERPDARLNRELEGHKALLAGAEWGWKATLYPAGGSRYTFLFTFSENDRVKMLGDINSTTATEEYESTYRLKAMQRPTLLFDTYSYLHILADPDETKSGGDKGEGRYSDFEFYFDEVAEDRIELTGNYNGSRLVLERATPEDAGQYFQNIGETISGIEKLDKLKTYFKRMQFEGNAFDIAADIQQRTISFLYYEGNIQKAFTSEFYYGEEGIELLTPFSSDRVTISTLGNITYNSGSNTLNLIVNGEEAATIEEATVPVKIDPLANSNFISNPANGSYNFSITGFTVENELDAFDIFSIPDFYYLIFWSGFGPIEENGTESSDLLGFINVNWTTQSLEIAYGPAVQTTLMDEGKISFAPAGSFDVPVEEMPAPVTATLEQLAIPEGYYVIQTEEGFDLVSAKDAKAWISFF